MTVHTGVDGVVLRKIPPAVTIRAVARAMMLVAITSLLVFGSFVIPASAHAGDQSYLYFDISNEVTTRLELPFGDVREFLGITIEGSEDEVAALITANADALREYALQHVQIGVPGAAPWDLTFQQVARVESTDYVGVTFLLPVTGDEIPQMIEVTLDPFFDDLPDRDALLLIGTDWSRGLIENESSHLVRFVDNERRQIVDLGESSQWNNFSASVPVGLDHIRTGVDHILFVVVLVLPAVLVYRSGAWQPVDGFASSLWRVLKIVSMFTIAHSITFTLAGIGLVPTPSARVVESIIAASIAVAALHNLWPVLPEKEWAIAFVFGLFHGFGFASLIAELDVDTTTQLVSLLGRNLGIEIGQALVVLLAFPGLFLLRRTRIYQPVLTISSIGLVVASIGWMSERLFDAPDWTSKILDRVFAFPRVLLAVVLLTVVALVIYQSENRRNRLLPTAAR